jgi:FkbM family methyltransferase
MIERQSLTLKQLKKEETLIRKITIRGYIYLIVTIILKKIFKIFNTEISKRRKNFDEIYLYHINNKPCIFDVGANIGQSIKRFKNIFLNPIIHSFEPVKECFDIINNKYYDKNITINNFALGNYNNFKFFNVNKLTYTSSFLDINKQNNKSFLFEKKRKEKVKIIKLDNYIKNNNIKYVDVLKIDTQGYELEVLKGAKNSLKRIKFIEIEITLDNIYKGNPPFYQIDYIMRKNNFEIYQLGEFSYQDIDDRLKSFDILYKNSLLQRF